MYSRNYRPITRLVHYCTAALQAINFFFSNDHASLSTAPTKPERTTSLFLRILCHCLPSIFFASTRRQLRTRGGSSTAWIDGIRGLSAIVVTIHHFFRLWTGEHDYAYQPPRHPFLIQLPILRLLTTGDAMVSIFFGISGFALSYKSVKLMRKNPYPYQELLKSLGSSIARRYCRLMLPIIVMFAIVGFFRYCGAYDWDEQMKAIKGHPKTVASHLTYPPKLETFFELQSWFVDEIWKFAVGEMLFYRNKYDYHANVSFIISSSHLYT